MVNHFYLKWKQLIKLTIDGSYSLDYLFDLSLIQCSWSASMKGMWSFIVFQFNQPSFILVQGTYLPKKRNLRTMSGFVDPSSWSFILPYFSAIINYHYSVLTSIRDINLVYIRHPFTYDKFTWCYFDVIFQKTVLHICICFFWKKVMIWVSEINCA